MSLIRILVKLLEQYLLHLHGIKSSGFIGIFGVWIKASERHANGEKVSLDKNFSMISLDLLTFVIHEKSLPNSQMRRVANKWCWHWPQLFTLPSLAITQIKLILK